MFSQQVQIRTQLQPGDVGYLTYLHGKIYAEEHGFDLTFEGYVSKYLSEFAARTNPRERIWLAEQGADGMKGAIAIVENSPEVAQLRWFLLHPDLRGLGLGKRLLTLAVDFARQQQYQQIILGTTNALATAKTLYEAAGFTLVKAEETYIWGNNVILEDYQMDLL
jgi:GNAT superfamily N-acetyltransferase